MTEEKSEIRNIELKIAIGAAVSSIKSTLLIYAVTTADPLLLIEKEISSTSVTVEFDPGNSSYLYAVCRIREFELDNTSHQTQDRAVLLVSVFTPDTKQVALCERSSVATAYCFAQFIGFGAGQSIVLSDPQSAFHIALGMKNNFVVTESGELSDVISSPPNALQSNSMAVFNFLSNIVYYCIAEKTIFDRFTKLTGSGSLFEALFNLARKPFTEVQAIYDLAGNRPQIFGPSLPSLKAPATPVPDQWTLAVKINDSGSNNFMISGTGYLTFDENDRVWISNNTRQGTPNSSTFCIVLEPDGKPASFSPLFGGGLLGGGIGITSSPKGDKVYVGNFGWGPTEWNPQKGSISVFGSDGKVLSSSEGITNHISRAQGMAFDHDQNLWICSWGTQAPLAPAKSKFNYASENSSVVVYLKGDPNNALVYEFDSPKSPYHGPFGIAVDKDNNVYIANSGDKGQQIKSSVYKLKIKNKRIEAIASWESDYSAGTNSPSGMEGFRMMGIGPRGDIFVVGIASNRVVRLDHDLNYIGQITNEVFAPWGITFDTNNVMYVANFNTPMESDGRSDKTKPGPYGVTIIENADGKTAKLMTLPTGGEEVTLANGYPLYGNAISKVSYHCYDPLMRMTSSAIDRAGNLWVCNNWKPSIASDFYWGDPGGDGVVAFIGVAAPAPRA